MKLIKYSTYEAMRPYTEFGSFFPPWRWGGSSTQAWTPTYVSILRIPQMIWVWRPTMEWYWQGKTEELGEKPVPVPLCPPQIPHGLTRERTRASAVRGRRLTTWAMARPRSVPWHSFFCNGATDAMHRKVSQMNQPHIQPQMIYFVNVNNYSSQRI
jgi:hypothetical protein